MSTTDIVERLGYYHESQATGLLTPRNHDGPEAAAEITRLRAEVAERETPPEKLARFLDEHGHEIDEGSEDEYSDLLAKSDTYVGALTYAGNTVSYIKSKADNYGNQLSEAHRRSGAAIGVSVLDHIVTIRAQAAEARNKALEEAARIAHDMHLERSDNAALRIASAIRALVQP